MIDVVAYYVLPTALALLPATMDSPAARAMLLAIGLQESRFLHRDQVDPYRVNGPALGLWQNERGGAVRGVLTHPRTRRHALTVLELLRYDVRGPTTAGLERATWEAIEHNDLLACCFARLNLWWLPSTLAAKDEPIKAWEQYLAAWRPGEPKPDTWRNFYTEAWARVENSAPIQRV